MITAESIKMIAREFHRYELSDEAARNAANVMNAMTQGLQALDALGLEGIEPPFGYQTMVAEASRVRRR